MEAEAIKILTDNNVSYELGTNGFSVKKGEFFSVKTTKSPTVYSALITAYGLGWVDVDFDEVRVSEQDLKHFGLSGKPITGLLEVGIIPIDAEFYSNSVSFYIKILKTEKDLPKWATKVK